jgi:hypothetical protein
VSALSERPTMDRQMNDLTEITPYWGHIPSIPIPHKCVNDVNDTLEERA